MKNKLFTPFSIGKLTIPNRIVRSATAEQMCDEKGFPKPTLKSLYRELALGGLGMLITGHAYIHPTGKAHAEMMGIYSDELVAPLRELVDVVHQDGGLIAVQINHAGMRTHIGVVEQTIAPSAFDTPYLNNTAREMSIEEIEMLIDAFAQAARRAKIAGFDAIQLHAAHGFLISEFLSPYANRRGDDWGGSSENRLRFLRRVVTAVREQIGEDYPLFIKLAVAEGVEAGISETDTVKNISALAEMGLDGLEISGGISGAYEFNSRLDITYPEQEGFFRPYARLARKYTRLPIFLVGGLRSKNVMEDVLSSGDADFIALCRPLICETDLPNRLRNDQQVEAHCISANLCWAASLNEGISCKCPI